MSPIHELTPRQILDWTRRQTPLLRVRTAQDAIRGGLSLAMSPLLVNWNQSASGFGETDHYLVHNVNIGSNPIEGTTVLGTVRVPAGAVERVEFVMVISKLGRVETEAGHGMLRFLFHENRRPLLLDQGGFPMADNAELSDLVVSWEAWRPPRVGFDPVAGLAPQTYALTARCYDGSVRCLSDAILDRPWICYPLEFPTVPHAADELLYVTLLLADAVARHTIGSILEKKIDDTRNQPDDYQDEKLEDWLELRDQIQAQHLPEDPIGEILQGKVGYHLLLRSCITMTLLAVDWANVRIHQRGGLGEPARIRVSPESLPEFFDNVMHRRRLSTLLALPSAMHWLMQNQTVIPARAHKLLDEVGLLQRENGLPIKRSFDNRKQSPYGVLGEHLIY